MSHSVRSDGNSQSKLRREAAVVGHRSRRVIEVCLLGRFLVRVNGDEVVLPHSTQRPVAYLAICRRAVTRSELATALWPDSPPELGLARLRNTLWKVKRRVPGLVVTNTGVALANGLRVDLDEARRLAQELLAHEADLTVGRQFALFGDDLLVDWEEEWLDLERRAFSALRLRALEACARRHLEASRFYEAEHSCRQIIQVDPYRESAHLLLAHIYIAEGNGGLALQELFSFQRRLQRDLGVIANERIRKLVLSIGRGTMNTTANDAS